MDAVSEIQQWLRKYKESRVGLLKCVQEMVNLRNQLTYLSNESLQKAIGMDVKSSRTTFQLYDRLSELSSDMTELRAAQNDAMLGAASTLEACRSDPGLQKDLRIDIDLLEELIGGAQQQHVLECAVADRISAMDASVDPDCVVTMLACFEHPPYLSLADLEAVLGV
mmetsp:Transcript_32157/g.70856  ORF Transcript_32157/g.70856 Transcript_32157/m.70856 type:complete len:167 (-) Transcript_32157:417-917(-)